MKSVGAQHRASGPVRLYSSIGLLSTLAFLLMSLERTPGTLLIPGAAALALSTIVLGPIGLVSRGQILLSRSSSVGASLWCLLMVWCLMTVFWSTAADVSAKRVLLVFGTGSSALILLWSQRQDVEYSEAVVRTLVVAGTILAWIGLSILAFGTIEFVSDMRIQTLRIGPIALAQRLDGAPPWIRVTSLLGNPNALGFLLAVSLNCCFALGRRLGNRRVVAFLAAPQFVCLIATLSRSGFGLALAGLAIQSLLRRRGGVNRLVLATVLGFSLVAILGVVVANRVQIEQSGSDRTQLGLTGREDAWRPMIDAFELAPLHGQGFGIVFEEILQPAGVEIGAHNAHLMIASEIGVIGYALVLALWIGGVIHAVWACSKEVGIARDMRILACAALAGLVFQQFFEAGVLRFTISGFIWIVFIGEAWRPWTGEVRRPQTKLSP